MRSTSQSLHDQVADTLRHEIFSGALPPGSFVDELALSERLDISRTPLREALKAWSGTNRAVAVSSTR